MALATRTFSALAESEELWTESEMTEERASRFAQDIVRAIGERAETPLTERLPPEYRPTLRYAAKRIAMDLNAMDPWEAALLLMSFGAERNTRALAAGVDMQVLAAAQAQGKRLRWLEELNVADFELFASGRQQKIVDFRADASEVSVAMLVDFSGSMDVAVKREAARDVAFHVLSWLAPGKDEVGLFAFDRTLQELEPFRKAPGDILKKLDTLKPYGETSLFDAIADTGRHETANRKEGAVDIVHTPPAIPAAVLFLGPQEILDATLYRRCILRDSEPA